MNVEIVNTGSELMLGRVLNTHQQWLCSRLADLGHVVTRQVAVADTGGEIQNAVREALGRAESFDPRQDTIVRVQARKLRERLAAYYAAEGSAESCRIVYRPGSYLPAFTGAHEAVSKSQRTVAVLPLTNLTADSSAGYFCDGLAEELIDLERVREQVAAALDALNASQREAVVLRVVDGLSYAEAARQAGCTVCTGRKARRASHGASVSE